MVLKRSEASGEGLSTATPFRGTVLEFFLDPFSWLFFWRHRQWDERRLLVSWLRRKLVRGPIEDGKAWGAGWRAHHELALRLARRGKKEEFVALARDGKDTDPLLTQAPEDLVRHSNDRDAFIAGFRQANAELAEYANAIRPRTAAAP